MVKISEYIIEKLHINKSTKLTFGDLEYNKPTINVRIYNYLNDLVFSIKYGNIDDLKKNKDGSYKISFYSPKNQMHYKLESISKNENNIYENYLDNERGKSLTFYLQGNAAKKFLEESLEYDEQDWMNFKFFENYLANFKNITKNYSTLTLDEGNEANRKKWLSNF